LESGEIEQLKNESRTSEDVVFGFPDDIVKSSKCIKNIEDIVMKLDMQVSSV
jgi:predicted nucleotidyltransferase component of viral defense system